MVARRVPVHRPARSVGGAGGRPVSRPGVSGDGKSNFQSPYQPPPARLDLAGDVAALQPDAWQIVHAAELFWRVRPPAPAELEALTAIPELSGGAQVQAMNSFLARNMHPDDIALMLEKMTDPDDSFGTQEYQAVYRAVVTAGTARPFWQSSGSPAPLLTRGEPYGPNWLFPAYRHRSKRS